MNGRSDKRNFFERLYSCCEGCIELRIIKNGRVIGQHFFDLVDHESITECCENYKDANIYFGVGTRDASGSGAKENIVNIPALWTDVDYKDIKPVEVKARLDSFPYRPAAAVLTGHGVHFYWILREPSERDDFERIEDLLRRIACHFNGDRSACEIARVLRVPGSVNVKYEPVPVKLHFLNDFSYNLADFDGLPPSTQTKCLNNGKSTNPPGWMVEAFKGITEGGNDQFNGRDVTGIKLAGYWIEKLEPDETFKILQCWNARNEPPLDEKDLRRIVNSACKYKKGEPQNVKRISLSFG